MVYVIILLIIVIISLIFYNKKKIEKIDIQYYNKLQEEKDKLQKEIEDNFVNKRKKELEKNLLIEFGNFREHEKLKHEIFMGKLKEEQSKLEAVIKTGEETIRQLEKRKREQTQFIEAAIADKKKIIDVEVQAYRDVETQKAATAVTQWAATARSQEEANLCSYRDEVAQSKSKMLEEFAQSKSQLEEEFAQNKSRLQAELLHTQQQIETAKAELDDYKKKQEVINEAILRQRELEEKQDFYRVCLSEFTIEDITLLQEIRQKLHTSESLNKLIYDVYISKAVQEMVKRVLQGGAPSGIYKITRMKTGEIYIGKSTNVKDRWQQHCKTVFGAGTIAHSILHTTMQKDGLQNFTFELVEEVPKEKLTEREKYWINFYGSKEYGLNERNG